MKGILLINLGTPDSPSVRDVRKYLSQFLNDPYVMDIDPVSRFFLVNFIIVPFRAKKSAKLYEHIWTKEGSPLLVHGKKLRDLLQQALGADYCVALGMRYQNPSIESAFRGLADSKVDSIIAIPLYPQYALSSTGSTIAEVERVAKKMNYRKVRIVDRFFDRSDFTNALAGVAKAYDLNDYDHFLFSYHGLPERQIRKVYPNHCRINDECCASVSEKNIHCYRAACFETTRQLVKRLNIPEGKYTTAFQSRLDDKWLKPYSDKVVEEKARQGVKRMLVFSPAFVADCLETLYEIGIEYEKIFKENGGEKLQLAESLNEDPLWVEALKKMITAL